MKKFILGIIVVFFLQFGFVAYHATNRDIAAVKKIAGEVNSGSDLLMLAITNSQADPEVALLDQEFFIQTADFPTGESIKPREFRRTFISKGIDQNAKSIKAVHRAKVIRDQHLVASHKPVKRPGNKDGSSKKRMHFPPDDLVAVDQEPDHKGKSFIAKALPIIKKPYDWLKALGSRLK